MKTKWLAIFVFLMSVAVVLFADQSNRPSDQEIRLYMHNKIRNEKEVMRIGRWMMENGIEVLPLLLEIEEKSDNTFTKSGVMHVIERSANKENAKSVIDRLLQPDTSDGIKTTALEIAEKFGYKGERYRSVLLEVLSTTEYGGLQKTLLKLLRSYGKEEDAELVLEVFKNTDNRDIKSVASDTLLAIGGPDIVGPWEEFWLKWKAQEPERQRKKRAKEERMAKEVGVELPARRPSRFIEFIERNLQSLKDKIEAQGAGTSQEETRKSSPQGGDGEYDEDQASSIGQKNAAEKSGER